MTWQSPLISPSFEVCSGFSTYPPMICHVALFMYFLYRFLSVVHDVYTQNFIMTAIGRKKIIYNISWEDPAIDHTAGAYTRQLLSST